MHILYCRECVPMKILAMDPDDHLSEQLMEQSIRDPATGKVIGKHTDGKLLVVPTDPSNVKLKTESTDEYFVRMQVVYQGKFS